MEVIVASAMSLDRLGMTSLWSDALWPNSSLGEYYESILRVLRRYGLAPRAKALSRPTATSSKIGPRRRPQDPLWRRLLFKRSSPPSYSGRRLKNQGLRPADSPP